MNKGVKLATAGTLLFWPLCAIAQTELIALVASTERAFDRVAPVERVADPSIVCGGGGEGSAVYCTTENTIFLEGTADGITEAYHLAHLYGHNLQVAYGIADIALREVTRRPNEETVLRGQVTRQVECLAGMLFTRAGLPETLLTDLFEDEPFTGPHWGRRPTELGPQVSIGLATRNAWFLRGQRMGQPSACSVGEISSELIVQADAVEP